MSALHQVPTTDLHALIGADTRLHRFSGSEYAGACPKCGGKDRLHVHTAKGWWFCRECSPLRGDSAGYLMWRDNLSFPEACRTLEGLPAMPPKPTPLPVTAPDQPWRSQARQVVDACYERLAQGDVLAAKALAYLLARGIDANTIVTWRLGYNPGPVGDTTGVTGSRVHCGITIPLWAVDGSLWAVGVRLAKPDSKGQKYKQVTGGRTPLYGQPTQPLMPGRTLLVLEGWFDCMLATRLAPVGLDVVATGSNRLQHAPAWYGYLNHYPSWLIGYDSDARGQEGVASWAWSERAKAIQVPAGKDLTEFWQMANEQDGWQAADRVVRDWLLSLVEG